VIPFNFSELRLHLIFTLALPPIHCAAKRIGIICFEQLAMPAENLRRNEMKTNLRTMAFTFGVIALAFSSVTNSSAQCGGLRPPKASPSNWNFQPEGARLLETAFVTVSDSQATEAPIVGLWHIKFVSEGTVGVPDGTEIDAGYAQWHSDGTEFMNSGARSPITSSFCMGVWKSLGGSKYKLNHFAIAWDSTGSNLVGPANIKEEVTLDPTGDKFAGTFTIDQYDESGNNLGHAQGNITGTRINVNTKEQSIF
jgi:hypothetical protein